MLTKSHSSQGEIANYSGCVLQINVLLIVLFNYYYTFLQLDPKDMSDQLKRAGASIPAVRPGRATADYITKTLNRMSILGSAFLGALAAAPPLVESVTGLQVLYSEALPRLPRHSRGGEIQPCRQSERARRRSASQ